MGQVLKVRLPMLIWLCMPRPPLLYSQKSGYVAWKMNPRLDSNSQNVALEATVCVIIESYLKTTNFFWHNFNEST